MGNIYFVIVSLKILKVLDLFDRMDAARFLGLD